MVSNNTYRANNSRFRGKKSCCFGEDSFHNDFVLFLNKCSGLTHLVCLFCQNKSVKGTITEGGKKSGNATMEVMSVCCSVFLPWSLAVHPAELRSCGAVLVCVRWPDRSWAQFRSSQNIASVCRRLCCSRGWEWIQVGSCWCASMP